MSSPQKWRWPPPRSWRTPHTCSLRGGPMDGPPAPVFRRAADVDRRSRNDNEAFGVTTPIRQTARSVGGMVERVRPRARWHTGRNGRVVHVGEVVRNIVERIGQIVGEAMNAGRLEFRTAGRIGEPGHDIHIVVFGQITSRREPRRALTTGNQYLFSPESSSVVPYLRVLVTVALGRHRSGRTIIELDQELRCERPDRLMHPKAIPAVLILGGSVSTWSSRGVGVDARESHCCSYSSESIGRSEGPSLHGGD